MKVILYGVLCGVAYVGFNASQPANEPGSGATGPMLGQPVPIGPGEELQGSIVPEVRTAKALQVYSPDWSWISTNRNYPDGSNDSVRAYVHPDEKELQISWIRDSGNGPWFPNGSPFVGPIEAFYPTKFTPAGVKQIVGTDSFILWGQDRRDNLVIERWYLNSSKVEDGVLTPGSVRRIDDLFLADYRGLRGSRFLYDLNQPDPTNHMYGEPISMVFLVEGTNDVLTLDFRTPAAGASILASAANPSSFPTPELGVGYYGMGSSTLNVHLGQLVCLIGDTDFVLVQDSDKDGVPDNVYPIPKEYGDLLEVQKLDWPAGMTYADYAGSQDMQYLKLYSRGN